MRDPAVAKKFNYTILSLYDELNDQQTNQIQGLNLSRGFDANNTWRVETIDLRELQNRLDAGTPSLFFLWEPHAIMTLYKIGRVNLPVYTDQKHFDLGKSDWKRDILEKLVSPDLFTVAPDVHQLVSRFTLTFLQQQSMMAEMMSGTSVFRAACDWLRNHTKLDSGTTGTAASNSKQENTTFDWKQDWLSGDSQCDAGLKVVKNLTSGESTCTDCAAGYFSSAKDSASSCNRCQPGRHIHGMYHVMCTIGALSTPHPTPLGCRLPA